MGLKWQGKSVFRSHHSFLAYVIAQARYDRTGELKFLCLFYSCTELNWWRQSQFMLYWP